MRVCRGSSLPCRFGCSETDALSAIVPSTVLRQRRRRAGGLSRNPVIFVNDSPDVLLDREFATSRDELRLLPALLERARERCPLSDDHFYNLVIALTEAVNNAIVHGNRNDAAKRVHYRVSCRPDGIHCVVEDEGEGFELDDVADPVAPENLLRDGGRGLFIIRALMRDVRTRRLAGGMRVEFVCPRE